MNDANALCVSHLKTGYGKKVVIEDVSFSIPKGQIVSIIGPNGCGKSTVLRSIMGNLPPMSGSVSFDGVSARSYAPKDLAKKVAYLSQTNLAPEDMTVRRLVGFGRVPHRRWAFAPLSEPDKQAINSALRFTATEALQDHLVSDLSGGERQRVWLAMVIAQEPDILLLDEPTTYLDISHQLEIMELLRHLNKESKTSIVMVLHDLNQAMKYSDQVIVMRSGEIYSAGTPAEIGTEKMLEEVYGLHCALGTDEDGAPVISTMKLASKCTFNKWNGRRRTCETK